MTRRLVVQRLAPVLALAVLAMAVSVVVRHEIYPDYSWNRDEPVYLWQTQGLAEGQLVTTDGGAPDFLQPWLTGARDGTFFSQYTPGWPLALTAADVLLGSAGAALAVAAALAVVGMYALALEVTRSRTLALISAALMTASPILVVQSGTYLGYLFSLGLGLLFGTALLAGLRTRRTWLLVAAGLLLGWIFLTRPFDAVLWAAPFAAYAAIVHRPEWGRLVRAALWVGLGVAPLFAAALLYNRHVTGSPTEFPITAADPLDTFGFGVRRIMPLWTPVDYTVVRALRGAGRNLFFLPAFMIGSFLGVVLAAVGLWLRRRDRSTLLLVLLGASFPIGYFFFWGIYLSGSKATLSGPLYYIPLYAPLCIFVATALVAAWQRRVLLGVAAIALLVVGTGVATWDKLDRNREISDTQAPWRDSVDGLPGRALVIVDRSGPYLLHLNPFSANTPDIDDGRIVYAVDRGSETLGLIASYPHRTPYLQRTDRVPRDALSDPQVPAVTLERIDVVRGRVLELRANLTNPTDGAVVVTYLQVGDRLLTRVLATDARRGDRFETTWTVGAPGTTGVDAELATGTTTFAVGLGSGSSETDALAARRMQANFDARAVDGEVEVLTPGDGALISIRGSKVRNRQVDTSGVVDVRVEVSGRS